MAKNRSAPNNNGFTLIELVIQVSIFSIVAAFMIGITLVATQVKNRELAQSETLGQLNFLTQTIQRLVRESSLALVKNGGAVAQTGSTLELNRAGASTTVSISSETIRLQEGLNPQSNLTSDKVVVDGLSFTRYSNYPGPETISFSITLHYSSGQLFATSTRTIRSSAGILQPNSDY